VKICTILQEYLTEQSKRTEQ